MPTIIDPKTGKKKKLPYPGERGYDPNMPGMPPPGMMPGGLPGMMPPGMEGMMPPGMAPGLEDMMSGLLSEPPPAKKKTKKKKPAKKKPAKKKTTKRK